MLVGTQIFYILEMWLKPKSSVGCAAPSSIWNSLLVIVFLSRTAIASSNLLHLSNPAVQLDATITPAPAPTLVSERLLPLQGTSGGRNACSALSSIYGWCSSDGYTNLSGQSALASCACYNNGTWLPKVFDGLATSCYNYIRSVQPGAVSSIAQYLNVCFIAGDLSKSLSSGSKACSSVASILTQCGTRSNTQF